MHTGFHSLAIEYDGTLVMSNNLLGGHLVLGVAWVMSELWSYLSRRVDEGDRGSLLMTRLPKRPRLDCVIC